MNPVDDLTFLDPVAPPPPANSSERAAVRTRGRRRRLVRLGLTSSPVVLAVAAAVAIGLAVTAGPSSQATVVPAKPTELNMTGAAPTAPGCPTGTVLDTITRDGVTYTAVAAPAQGLHHYVCVRLADGTVVHQAEFGTDLRPFPDGSYLVVDGLGHIFANLDPGNIYGVMVIIPGHDTVKMLGIYGGSVDQSSSVFALSIMERKCVPSCADGGALHFRAVWDATTDTYVLRDAPLSKFLLGDDPPSTASPYLAPETYRTSGGATLYPGLLPDGVLNHLVHWHIATGPKPFTIHFGDFIEASTHGTCALVTSSASGVDGHVVPAHTSYMFEVDCPFNPDLATMSVLYAPQGTAVARWTTAS